MIENLKNLLSQISLEVHAIVSAMPVDPHAVTDTMTKLKEGRDALDEMISRLTAAAPAPAPAPVEAPAPAKAPEIDVESLEESEKAAKAAAKLKHPHR